MATYVLVHGSAHGGWCYQELARLLRAQGHDVYTPTLTGLGERAHLLSADVDLELHVTDVANVLFYEDLHDVVLVGHSYGGLVITGAADRAIDRVGHLVFLDAITPVNGESLLDFGGGVETVRDTLRVVDGVELVLFPGTGPLPTHGLTDPDQIAWAAPRLTPHPWKTYLQPLELRNESAVWAIPQTHIVASPPLAEQHPERLAAARDAGRVFFIDTGHDVMMTEPDAVADILLGISE